MGMKGRGHSKPRKRYELEDLFKNPSGADQDAITVTLKRLQRPVTLRGLEEMRDKALDQLQRGEWLLQATFTDSLMFRCRGMARGFHSILLISTAEVREWEGRFRAIKRRK